jgi:hypothetical protein
LVTRYAAAATKGLLILCIVLALTLNLSATRRTLTPVLQSGQYARFQVCGDPWPAKFFALIFGPSQPGADTLPNHRPLELGKDAHHLK